MSRDADKLEEIRENYTNDEQEWSDIYNEGNTDLQVLTGDIWDALDSAGAKQRTDANRPMIAPDELNQYINQGVNDWLANPRGINFAAALGGKDAKASNIASAFYQNVTREIQYRSHSDVAFGTAVENMFQRSFGYCRLSSKLIHGELFDPDTPPDVHLLDQQLWIESFPDPTMVLPYPYFERPDLSDMKRCFVKQWQPVRDFKREYKDATVRNFTQANTSQARDWFTPDLKRVLKCEYWEKEVVGSKRLLILKPRLTKNELDPVAVWESDWLATHDRLPNSDRILRDQKFPLMQVTQTITNGLEILEENTWDGEYIPITGCFGKIIYVDDGNSGAQRKILSMPRLARSLCMLLAYLATCEAEIAGTMPKFPYFYYAGTLTPAMLELLAKSVSEPVVGIEVQPYPAGTSVVGGQPLPFPIRNPYEGNAIQYLELAKEATRRAIQAALGTSPQPTPVQRENQKSGAAMKEMESSSQKGSFHFVNHADDMVRQMGVLIEDKIRHTHDTMRDVPIRTHDGKGSTITINDPNDPNSPQIGAQRFLVTVNPGPSIESERGAATNVINRITDNLAEFTPLIGPQATKAILAEMIRQEVQGPSGDELANLINPPPPDPGAPPDPAMLQQLMQENQQLKQAIATKAPELQAKAAQVQTQEQHEDARAQLESQTAIKKAEIAATATMSVAQAKIDAENFRSYVDAMESRLAKTLDLHMEHFKEISGQLHDAAESLKQQRHDRALSAQEHGQTLQQTAQAAALAPPPATAADNNGAGAGDGGL
jgi:hypothetical protein